jgi:hypothetical protein
MFRATQSSSSGSLPRKKNADGEGPRARDPFLLSKNFLFKKLGRSAR